MHDVKVSVLMPVYNHEKYVEQAIQSVLKQKTDFTYELLIGEDCSLDHTRDIADAYQKMHPDIIKVLHYSKNVGASRNVTELKRKCNGQYVTILEGDDYYNCENKLQFQAEFLDSHPEYIGVAHNVKTVGERGEKLSYDLEGFHLEKEHVYTKQNALNFEIIGHVSGWMHRNIWKSLPKKEWNMIERCRANGDLKMSVILGLKGDVYYFENVWSVYRRRFKENTWSGKFRYKNMSLFYYEQNVEMKKLLLKCYGISVNIENKLLECVYNSFLLWKRNPTSENAKIFIKMIKKKELKKWKIVRYFFKQEAGRQFCFDRTPI